MTVSKQPARTTFKMDAISVVGSVPYHEIPPGTHSTIGGKRRWQDIGAEIMRLIDQQRAYVIKIDPGHNAETVRTGVASELLRFGMRARIRSVVDEDGATVLYFTAVPK